MSEKPMVVVRRLLVVLAVVALALAAFLLLRRHEKSSSPLAGLERQLDLSHNDAPKTARIAKTHGELRGLVIDAVGRPVAAQLSLRQAAARAALDGRAGDDGAFRFDAVPAGQYTLWAWNQAGDSAVRVVDIATQLTTLSLQFSETDSTLSGSVLDAGGGVVTGAELEVGIASMAARSVVALGFSNYQGRYRLRLPVGDYTVSVRMPGYADSVAITRVPKGGAQRDFRLYPAGSLAGRVTDDAGLPVAGASVSLQALQSAGSRVLGAMQSASDGGFAFEGIEPGRYFAFASSSGRAAEAGPIEVGVAERRAGVVLTLAAGLSLNGVVVDPHGTPLADTALTI